jgi:CelD/BcsL family acetyltransferase involved in cellulose biosynthesis
VYRGDYEPVLVLGRDSAGRLEGLLPLAVHGASGRVVVAGDQQAEYQSWVSTPEMGGAFAWEAVKAVQREFPGAVLRFKYLPPGTPVGWLADSSARRLCLSQLHVRPLLRLGDGKEISESLAKKSNKNRLKQLGKRGKVELHRLTDPAEREAAFDAIAPLHDVRHLAMRGSAPFHDDAVMKAFGRALLKVPGLLHVTVLKAGDALVAAHFGVCSGAELQFGLVAYNPWLATYSPGKFLIYYLGQRLMEESCRQLDLTAGGDPYKERFANAWDQVHTLSIFPTALRRWSGSVQASLKRAARKVLSLLNLTPNQVRALLDDMKALRRAATIGGLMRAVREWLGSSRELRLYACTVVRASEAAPEGPIRRDALGDLLTYRPDKAGASRRKFMSAALSRIQVGQHVYTCVQEGSLQQVAWLIEQPGEGPERRIFEGYPFPPNAAVVHFEHFGKGAGLALETACLRAVLEDAARGMAIRNVFVAMTAGDEQREQAVQKEGFTLRASLIEKTRLGRKRRRWVEAAEPRHR